MKLSIFGKGCSITLNIVYLCGVEKICSETDSIATANGNGQMMTYRTVAMW